MRTKAKSMEQLIEEQVRQWRFRRSTPPRETKTYPVVTISREPGSGGRIIGEKLAARLNLPLFHQEVMHEMAKSAKVSKRLVETLDERGLNLLEEWLASLVDTRHLWPDRYLKHLMKVVGTIGRHGHAVLIGRGANFILPQASRLSVRVVAPLELRARNVADTFGCSSEEARRRVIKTDSERRAFIRKYFNADVADPLNYDLLVNTGRLTITGAVDAICASLEACRVACPIPAPEAVAAASA
jgi:cytidylate kinase